MRDDAASTQNDDVRKKARSRLPERAAAGDLLALSKIEEIANPRNAYNSDAQQWANQGLVSKLGVANGIAMYADGGVKITTPDKFQLVATADSRTVLGESYSETYSVDKSYIELVKKGHIRTLAEIPGRKLVT